MFKRKLFKTLTLGAAALTLVACGNDDTEDNNTESSEGSEETSEETTEDEITLRIAWWGSQRRHDGTVEVIELYEEQNPHVEIQYEFFDFDGYINKLNTLVASDDVWDIFQLGGNYPTYIDVIEPLNGLVDDGTIDTENTNESYLETTTDDEGNIVGISLGVNSYGLAYNPEMFEEAGVEEPTENWTWEEFEEKNMQLHEELGIFGTSILDDFLAGGTIGVGPDMNFFDPDDETSLGFDDPSRLTEYIAMRDRLVEAGAYPDPGAVAEVTDIENDFVVTGEAAITWVATNQFTTLSEASGTNLKLANLPRKSADDPYGLTLNSSQMFSVPTSSEHKEEAAKFISFFLNDEEANEILRGERGVPIMSHIRETLESEATAQETVIFDYIDYVGEQHNDELNVIEHPDTPEIRAQYELLLDQVIYGELTPEEASQEIYDFAQETISR